MTAAEMMRRLDSFAALEDDWNSYGSAPIAPEAIAMAKRWVPIMADVPGCSVAPVPGGGVMFEWEEDNVAGNWECWKADYRKTQEAP